MSFKPDKILIIQTAFPGDVVLTLPMVQVIRKEIPSAQIDVIVTPQSATLLTNHYAISNIITYDKKGDEAGIKGFFSKLKSIKLNNYDLAIIPHRSFRSALLAYLAGIPVRIGFDKSKSKILYSKVIGYNQSLHEIDRNISLLAGTFPLNKEKEIPVLNSSNHEKEKIDLYLSDQNIINYNSLIGIAPGSVWMTKRWLEERYIELAKTLLDDGFQIVLIGGKQDEELCSRIHNFVDRKNILNAAGKFNLIQSAELISRCKVIITNDSAPFHIALAMRTKSIAIFGPTTPGFGFGPYDKSIQSGIETNGLFCKPCSIHGGNKCPTGTMDCMKQVTAKMVKEKILAILDAKQ